MPVVRRDRTFANSEIVQNLVDGEPIEQVTRASRVRLIAVVDLATDIILDVLFGNRSILTRGEPNVQATAGPSDLNDVIVDDVALPGENLTIRAENTNAATTPVLRFKVVKNAVA